MTKSLLRIWFMLGRLPFGSYRLVAGLVSAALMCLVFLFGRERRHVVLTNLSLCFPDASVFQIVKWCLVHMYLYLRTFLDRAWIWNGDAKMLCNRVVITNPQALLKYQQVTKPTIFLAPHFLGLDAAWSRLSLEVDMVTMYSNQKNPVLNQLILDGRAKYGNQLLLSRQQGVRPLVSAMKKGRTLYYLPDMDFGKKDSVFVDFFGVRAATVTAVSRLAKLLEAQVVPVTTRYQSGKYFVTLHDPLDIFSCSDEVESTQAMNHHIETWVRQNVSQYLWLHKRFKTRPAGESTYY